MPVDNFDGDTYVAFLDISGFKEMMKGDGRRAIVALDRLNTSGYFALNRNQNVNGFFISDCGILFVRNNSLSKAEKLSAILEVVKSINTELLDADIMLTTSIAFGQFNYHQRIEFRGIEKNPIYGNAYVEAYLDNEIGTPKLQPGQCRIIDRSLPNILNPIDIELIESKGKHHYYYWMINNPNEKQEFLDAYNDSYQLKYRGMLSALKKEYNNI